MLDLQGRRTLVTGGGTGIGFGCAQALIAAGAEVTIAGRREDVLADAVQKLGGGTRYVACDVTREDQVEAAVGAASRDGRLDILVANAGSGRPAAILQASAEDWDFSLRLNVIGTALCIKQAGLAMRERGGAIVAISSASAVKVQPWLASYNVSKAGLDMLVRCAAVELSPHRIRVNGVQPGYTANEKMETRMPKDLDRKLRASTPLHAPGRPADIGSAVAFLASDNASWITGQVIGVDGGLNIPSMPSMAPIAASLYGAQVVQSYGLPDYATPDLD